MKLDDRLDTLTHKLLHSSDAGLISTIIESINTYLVPVGTVSAYYGATAPDGWLLCDGAAIPAEHVDLIALVGATTPNLKGKVIVALNGADADFDTLGEVGGSKNSGVGVHTHSHDHGVTVNSLFGSTGTNNGNTGDNGNHDHAQASAGSLPLVVQVASSIGLHVDGDDNATYDTGKTGRTSSDGTHNHNLGNHSHNADHGHSAFTDTDATSTGSAGGNLQPYMVMNYIIKAG